MPLWRMILTAINLVGFRLGGAAIGLVSQIVLARMLPQHDVGVIFMAMSAAALISLVMTVGYPSLAMTCLPRYYALGRDSLVAAYHSATWHDTIIASVVVLAVLAIVIAFGILPATILSFVFLPAIAHIFVRRKKRVYSREDHRLLLASSLEQALSGSGSSLAGPEEIDR